MNLPQISDARLELGALLRGDAQIIARWVERWTLRRVQSQLIMIVLGAGAFGAAIGFWRAPLQGLYTAAKLPLILLLTASANALINGMFAPLLGLGLKMRESFSAVLTSFALMSAILGAFSPLVFFIIFNLPPLERGVYISPAVHGSLLLLLAGIIAFAGVTANLRLLQLLRTLGGDQLTSWKILFAWLAVNLVLGSQVSWILRPFIGAPELAIQFVRPDAFHGSFFETLFAASHGLFP